MADRYLFILTASLMAISVVVIYSLSSYTVLLHNYSPTHFMLRQLAFVVLSVVIMWSIARLDPDIWLNRLGFTLFFGSLTLLVLMPFMPLSLVSEVGGAKRWIKLGVVSLAPVEFFKIGFVFFLAWSFSRRMTNSKIGIKKEILRFLPYALLFGLVVLLIAVMQKDLGQAMVMAVTLTCLLAISGSSLIFFGMLLLAIIVAFVGFVFMEEHRIARILSWWSQAQNSILGFLPDSVATKLKVAVSEEPYQIGHSMNAIYNGGISGVGLGNGTFKLGFLSEVHTDFVLAGISEEFGFIGVAIICAIFIAILWRIVKIATRSGSAIRTFFCVGIGFLLAFAFLINAFGISGLIPIKGISVPLLSYGGSAMLASAVGIGMVLMVSKKGYLNR